jgi:Predicted membrane protein (DUF2142)
MIGRSEVVADRVGVAPARRWRVLAAALLPTDSPRARRFLYCALGLGFAYALINPPFAVNDERNHLMRAYEIVTGQWITKARANGSYHVAPVAYRDAMARYANVHREREQRIDPRHILGELSTGPGPDETATFSSVAGEYSPVPYLPQLPAVWLAIKLRLPALWHIYLARFAGVICFSILGSWSVAIAGRLGWLIFAAGLAPMALTQAAGLSVDGLINGLSLLFFALVAKGALLDSDGLSKRHQQVLLWLIALLGACRPATLSFVLALPAVRLQERDRAGRWRYVAQAFAVSAFTILIWNRLNRAVFETSVMPRALEQLAWTSAHPWEAARVWAGSWFTQIDDYVIQLLAFRDILSREMRYAGGTAATFYGGLLGLLALGAAWRSHEESRDNRLVAAYLATSAVAFTVARWLTIYLTLNAGGGHLRGMQGRFLLAALPAVLFALAALGPPRAARWLSAAPALRIITPIVVINGWCLLALIARYYLPVSVDWPY